MNENVPKLFAITALWSSFKTRLNCLETQSRNILKSNQPSRNNPIPKIRKSAAKSMATTYRKPTINVLPVTDGCPSRIVCNSRSFMVYSSPPKIPLSNDVSTDSKILKINAHQNPSTVIESIK